MNAHSMLKAIPNSCPISYWLGLLIWAAVMVASQEGTIAQFYDQLTILAAVPTVLSVPALTVFMPK